MVYWVALLVSIILITGLVSAGVLYVLFRRTPDYQWSQKVTRLHADARKLGDRYRDDLDELPERLDKELREVSRHAFWAYLKTFSTSALETYPGIGPATVEKLAGAGFRHLADLQNARIDIRGLGDKRLTDIHSAVQHLTGDAKARFDAGACREAREVEAGMEQVRQRWKIWEESARAQLRANTKYLGALEPFLLSARAVTFGSYLRRSSEPLVSPEVLAAPLPDWNSFLERAQAEQLRVVESAVVAEAAMRPSALTDVPRAAEGVSATASLKASPIAATATSGSRAETPSRRDVDLFQSARPLSSQPIAIRAGNVPVARPVPPLKSADDLETIIAFAYAAARADGRIARKERDVIAEYLAKRCGNDAAASQRAQAWSVHYESAAIDLEKCLQRLATRCPPVERRNLYALAVAIADATGPRNQREAEFLDRVAWALDVPAVAAIEVAAAAEPVAVAAATALAAKSERAQPAKPAPPASKADCLMLLEIEPATPLSADLVRRQFRRLSNRDAPEKVQTMGPDIVAFARAKCEALQAAAVMLLEQWGEELAIEPLEESPKELRHNPDLDAMFGAT